MSYDAPPTVSPFYLQYERLPYIRGANYIRPQFREHGPYGNFISRPIERLLPPFAFAGEELENKTNEVEGKKTFDFFDNFTEKAKKTTEDPVKLGIIVLGLAFLYMQFKKQGAVLARRGDK
jgi:hypothetical protein